MPPKRKAASGTAAGAEKKIRVEKTPNIDEPSTTSLSNRPKRKSNSEPVYNFTRPRNSNINSKKQTKTTKATPAAAPPSKRKSRVSGKDADNTAKQSPSASERARPTRVRQTSTNSAKSASKRKREESPKPITQRKKRGSVTKPTPNASSAPKVIAVKSAPKTDKTTKVPKLKSHNTLIEVLVPPVRRLTLQPSSAMTSLPSEAARSAQAVDDEDDMTDLDVAEQDTQYWLMKAEPDTRIEKGIDVAFPIDKLAAATEPEPWDGVRNYVARNHMRSMRKDDLAFFYHSNCKIPGIVGVMRIAEEHSVDESAFDPSHPYFDEKSDRDKPRWDCVKVEFVKKFAEIIPLQELKSTPELSDMQIAQKAYGRLSVQAVKPSEWKFILKRANESEDLGVVPTDSRNGHQSETEQQDEQ